MVPGKGELKLTGQLGDVMQESAQAAFTLLKSRAAKLGINYELFEKNNFHIHVPDGATPKDGPSAGVTMVTAIISALGNYPVRRDIAMTGEITLRGKVLAIGGLKEKTLAAYRAGVKTVLIPEANLRDLDDIDKEAKENLTFIPCSDANDVLKNALVI